MVKVLRIRKARVINELETSITNQSINDPRSARVLRVKPRSSVSTDRGTLSAYSGRIQSLPHKSNNGVFQNNLQRILPVMIDTDALNFSNTSSINSREDKKRDRQRRRCGAFLCSKLCCLLCTTLFIAGVLAAIATILALQLSKHSLSVTTTPVTTNFQITTSKILSPTSQINWLINGDGETGPCESGNNITHPTGWDYNGTITQTYYNNTYADMMYTDPGPSDRGQCYFFGQISAITSMWQTVNMTGSVNPFLIDNQIISFNVSAWIGGYQTQDDSAQISLTFTDQTNQKVGNTITLGPILAAARGNLTSLLFQQANGLVPAGARSFITTVTITRTTGSSCDGDIDNIAVLLYQ